MLVNSHSYARNQAQNTLILTLILSSGDYLCWYHTLCFTGSTSCTPPVHCHIAFPHASPVRGLWPTHQTSIPTTTRPPGIPSLFSSFSQKHTTAPREASLVALTRARYRALSPLEPSRSLSCPSQKKSAPGCSTRTLWLSLRGSPSSIGNYGSRTLGAEL
jgi:hypothetical protein